MQALQQALGLLPLEVAADPASCLGICAGNALVEFRGPDEKFADRLSVTSSTKPRPVSASAGRPSLAHPKNQARKPARSRG
ncbi:hypothetical protein A1355_19045 [Methylomonas koyamae]|uniref:Uncharacterized protein n=1 Tax=Methylomonas koyamae TaxID=702114 RepID=A0A177PA59_9GAMM|nr:hypothetical protein A1355_19045 [Methylomonas koyamae]